MYQQFCIIGNVAKNCFVQIPSRFLGKKVSHKSITDNKTWVQTLKILHRPILYCCNTGMVKVGINQNYFPSNHARISRNIFVLKKHSDFSNCHAFLSSADDKEIANRNFFSPFLAPAVYWKEKSFPKVSLLPPTHSLLLLKLEIDFFVDLWT